MALPHDYLVGTVPLIVGVALVVVLIAAVAVGRRVRRRQPPPERSPQPRASSWRTRREHDAGSTDEHG
ncbi:DUF6479 family protein [Actinacidiphila glaucinigra]|nr:DUF6479 family protein [Actinacidiphila glaucinigra]